ncbi:TPA: TraR/DksA C4-type zinc finger protein [Neisseria meningitidis]
MTDIIDQACALEERMRDYWLARHQEQAADAPSAQECEECGEIIPEARRLAVPGCRLCIECRREEEQRQKFKNWGN